MKSFWVQNEEENVSLAQHDNGLVVITTTFSGVRREILISRYTLDALLELVDRGDKVNDD